MHLVASLKYALAGQPKRSDVPAMLRNTVRGILGLVLAAAATWLANYLVIKIFGPEEAEPGNA